LTRRYDLYIKSDDVWETRFSELPRLLGRAFITARLVLVDRQAALIRKIRLFVIDSRPPSEGSGVGDVV